jgi:hypothetical protein
MHCCCCTRRSNYLGTSQLLRIAATWPNLRCLLFTSTYFVNNFKPRNSIVAEALHHVPLYLPLSAPDRTLTHEELVEALLAMDADVADAEAAALMGSLNFTSTYAFGKLLTEHLVNEAQLQVGSQHACADVAMFERQARHRAAAAALVCLTASQCCWCSVVLMLPVVVTTGLEKASFALPSLLVVDMSCY